MRHGRGWYDIRFAAIDQALEPAIQSPQGLRSAEHAKKAIQEHDAFILKKAKQAHDKRNVKLVKSGKPTKPFHLRSKDGAFLTILPPIVHNLKINKSPTREVFTFKGIQSSKGVTHDRETGLIYNNVYPDVDRKSGLIIPKTLVKTEDRPKKQLKTSRHKRKRIQSLDEVEKQLKKPKRVKQQREDWKTQEMNMELVKEWQPKKKRPKKPIARKPKKSNVRKPKKPSARKRKKPSVQKPKKASKKSKPGKRTSK